MKAYSYTRFSTREQQKGASLSRQMEKSAKYAADNGLVIDTSLKLHDVGSAFDGTNITKGALGAFIEAIDKGLVEPGSTLICESLDRVSRAEPMVALELFLGIIRKGITIVTLSDNQRYSKESIKDNSMLLFASIMVMIRANEESVQKSQRIGDAWQRKVKKALSGDTSGKILTTVLPMWMEAVNGRPTLIPERAEVVKRIIQMMKDGSSIRTVTKYLNREVPPWGKADKWSCYYLSNLTRNHALYGAFENNGVVGEIGYYPAVITKEEFDYLRHILSARWKHQYTAGSKKGKSLTNLFSGITTCGYCGANMTIGNRTQRDGTKRIFLGCGGARSGQTLCKCITWEIDDFEALFFMKVSQVDISTAVGADHSDQIEVLHKEVIANSNTMALAQKKIANLNAAIEIDMIPELVKSLRAQTDLYAELEKNQQRLESQLNAARMTSTKGSNRMRSLMTLFKTLAKCDDDLTLRRTRESLFDAMRTVVTKIVMYPSGPSANKSNTDMRYALVTFKSGVVMEISEG